MGGASLAALSFVAAAPAAEDSALTIEVNLELDFESERNFDLDDRANGDVSTIEPEIEVGIEFEPDEFFRTYLQAQWSREYTVREEGPNRDRNAKLEIEEAFFDWSMPQHGFTLRFGRQDFDDEREWVYNENLDGARLFFEFADLTLELSVSQEGLADVDLLNPDGDEKVNNFHIYGRYALNDEVDLSVYWLKRVDQRPSRESPEFFGLRSIGEVLPGLDHWVELAHVRGNDGSTDIRGYGVDVGATYTFDAPLTPYLTLAYAFGTGDSDPSDGTDKAFRQTGLQDNDGRFGGVTSFRYYGEVFDPELSNLSIYTAGVGFRPTRRSSFDIVFHYYKQDDASDELRDTGLDADPTGLDKDLGSEIDFILAHRGIPNLRLEAVLGYFMPGDAFGPDADDAIFTGFEIDYEF